MQRFIVLLIPLTIAACSSSDTSGGSVDGGTDDAAIAGPGSDAAGAAEPDLAPPPLIWPNEMHSANSDPWIAQHHDEITEMHPRALLINFANNRAASAVMDRWKLMSDAMSE